MRVNGDNGRGGNVPRPACEPRPTLTGQGRERWVVDRKTNSKGPGWRHGGEMIPTVPVPMTEPSPTLTAKAGGQWVLRPEWAYERPATVVCADPRIGRPGHKDREAGESQFAE